MGSGSDRISDRGFRDENRMDADASRPRISFAVSVVLLFVVPYLGLRLILEHSSLIIAYIPKYVVLLFNLL